MSTAVEIEKKYVIKIPDLEHIKTIFGYSESEIEQIYLRSPISVTHRVRRRTSLGKTVYTETEKRKIDKMSALEYETEITELRFCELIKEQREGSRPILKKRISFPYGGYVFEIDIYPEWKKSCILEIELASRDEDPKLPSFLELVKDVTGDKKYSNSSMSKCFPEELI